MANPIRLYGSRWAAFLALENAEKVASQHGKTQQAMLYRAMLDLMDSFFDRWSLGHIDWPEIQQVQRELKRIEQELLGFEPKKVFLSKGAS